MKRDNKDDFITVWRVGDCDLITLLVRGEYTVDWGDGSPSETRCSHMNARHLYAKAGDYTISVTNTAEWGRTVKEVERDEECRAELISMGRICPPSISHKIIDVKQWGTNKWTDVCHLLAGAENMTMSATDAPDLSKITDMRFMFAGCRKLNSPIEHWDVSNVNIMKGLFKDAHMFNQPLEGWDVSIVTDMEQMFYGALSFNQPIEGWEVFSLRDAGSMFRSAHSFNQPLEGWGTFDVRRMRNMFYMADNFNQPLNGWKVQQLADKQMEGMFCDTPRFGQKLDKWGTESEYTGDKGYDVFAALKNSEPFVFGRYANKRWIKGY